MKGKLYSIGVGPGDPELMTLKAVRLIKECPVVAIPKGDTDVYTAKSIVEQIVDLTNKPQEIVYMPMVKDKEVIGKAHQAGADQLIAHLEKGEDVAFITLGCPTVYATCIYVHKLVARAGYETELVPGVTSFCAVAARLNTSLCEKAEPLTVLPGSYREMDKFLDLPGNKIVMKSASQMPAMLEALKERNLLRTSAMVERCGLPGEVVHKDMTSVDGKNSYFSVILVKEKELGE